MIEIGGRLGAIYHDAEQLGDVALMTTAADTWAIIQANTDTTAIAASAISGLIEAVQQRDSALDELSRIEDGINELEAEGETSNPRLRGAAHVLYEVLKARWETDGLHLGCPGCEAANRGWGAYSNPDMFHDAIFLLCHSLFDDTSALISADRREEFESFLLEWAAKVEDELDTTKTRAS